MLIYHFVTLQFIYTGCPILILPLKYLEKGEF